MIFSIRWWILAAALVLSPLLAACDEAPQQLASSPAPTPAVTVVRAEVRDLRPSVNFSARVEALQKVELRARVDGFLETEGFVEGATVKAGDLLYVIERAPYQAAVASAEATVAVAQARFDRTELELKRQATLVSKEAAAQTKLDDAKAARDEAKGSLDKATADLEKARLQLSYTEIRAPIDGRIGKSIISVGNYVGPNSGVLATIVAQDPIGVTFPVSQREFIAVRENAGAGANLADVTVYVQLGKDKRYGETGKLNFVDVTVNQGTDAVDVRASFPNPDGLLKDGQLVTAVVEEEKAQPTLVVPLGAVQIDQQGTYVLTVDAEKKIAVTRVKTGRQAGNGMTVTEGLSEGALVVVEGIQKVKPGQVVDATEIKPEA